MLRRRLVRILPIFILIFWLAMMGMLAQRTGSGCVPTARQEMISSKAPPQVQDKWYGIYLTENTRVGFLNLVTIPVVESEHEEVHIRLSARMDLLLLGTQTDLTILGSARLDKEQGLRDADVRIRSGEMEWRVEAKTEKGNIELTVHTGGEVIPFTLPASSIKTSGNSRSGLGFDLPDIQPGQEAFVEAFDPIAMAPTRARVTCTGEETIRVGEVPTLTRVFAVEMNAMTTRAWAVFRPIEEGGDEIVQVELPIGITLRKISPEEAYMTQQGRGNQSLLQLAAIRPSGKTPMRGAQRMVVRITGIPADTPVPQDDSQRLLENDVLEIVPPTPPQDREIPPPSGTEFAEYLEADPLVQSSHPIVQETAREIIGDQRGAWSIAYRIGQWLWKNIEKQASPGVPSALEIIETRKGDCNEHAVLFTALARSVGLPTRICLGVVWSEEYQGFYYHAWPEVCIQDVDGAVRWYWIEPTLGQPIADATHIKLVTGGVRNWLQLLPFIGKLQLEVIDVQPPPSVVLSFDDHEEPAPE